jgi:hypothetical protein
LSAGHETPFAGKVLRQTSEGKFIFKEFPHYTAWTDAMLEQIADITRSGQVVYSDGITL